MGSHTGSVSTCIRREAGQCVGMVCELCRPTRGVELVMKYGSVSKEKNPGLSVVLQRWPCGLGAVDGDRRGTVMCSRARMKPADVPSGRPSPPAWGWRSACKSLTVQSAAV